MRISLLPRNPLPPFYVLSNFLLFFFRRYESQEVENDEGEVIKYSPYYLDDPSLTTGKHRTVLNFAGFRVCTTVLAALP